MSTATEDPPAQADRPTRKASKAAKVGWGVYRQVAAVLAAFGLAALLGHFWNIGWRGFLETVVGVWSATVRPAMEWVLHVVVTVPLRWLGITLVVPTWLRDYLSVGVILWVSYRRGGTNGLYDALLGRLQESDLDSGRMLKEQYKVHQLGLRKYLLKTFKSFSHRVQLRDLRSHAEQFGWVGGYSPEDARRDARLARRSFRKTLSILVLRRLRKVGLVGTYLALWPVAIPRLAFVIVSRYARWRNTDPEAYRRDVDERLKEMEDQARELAELPGSNKDPAAHYEFLLAVHGRPDPDHVFERRSHYRETIFAFLRLISPLLYLALLVAVNFWVMPHI